MTKLTRILVASMITISYVAVGALIWVMGLDNATTITLIILGVFAVAIIWYSVYADLK